MSEEKEKSKLDTLNTLMELIRMYPQAIKPETDAEAFLEELDKACAKLFESNGNDLAKADLAARFLYGIPCLIKPGIGIEAFVETLARTGTKYMERFKDERRSCPTN